ncbi:MAG: sulfatase-like hydrolase/transferase [Steroidobacteraceae bacterium]
MLGVDADQTFGPSFWSRVVYFVAALLALHATFGLAVWLHARLLCRGFPYLNQYPSWTLWVCWCLFGVFVVTGNSAWYPGSQFSSRNSLLAYDIAGLVPAIWIALLLGIAAVIAFFRALRTGTMSDSRRQRLTVLATLVIGGIIASRLLSQPSVVADTTTTGTVPNIILIGLDSLRNDLAGTNSAESITPNVDAFLGGSARFNDSTTPLARTFGSWIAILSGRHPVSTNARINLMPRPLVTEGDTLPILLKARGYATFYATDEVRFSNIDESYGFDHLVTPPIGATDFLLGKVNDLPLSNLVSTTLAARWLFPHSWANRAVYQTYRPAHFMSRLRHEFDVKAPVFAAIHLTLAHWPYNRAGQPLTRSRPLEIRAAYADAVREMDQQFGEVIVLLERRGLLRNALVVILSDHGEAMGRPEDSMMREVQRIEERWGSMWGHGTSVMSPHQYQVVLAFRGYGPSKFPGSGRNHGMPASLEDIAPTVMDLLQLTPPDEGFDGVSLAPTLRNEPGAADQFADRIRFTETDFNTESILQGRFNEDAALSEAGAYYEIDSDTGWVQFKSGRRAELLAKKERAAISGQLLLAALPSQEGGQKYFITNRQDPHPSLLEGRPDPVMRPTESRLWDALHSRFPGELAGNSHVP